MSLSCRSRYSSQAPAASPAAAGSGPAAAAASAIEECEDGDGDRFPLLLLLPMLPALFFRESLPPSRVSPAAATVAVTGADEAGKGAWPRPGRSSMILVTGS